MIRFIDKQAERIVSDEYDRDRALRYFLESGKDPESRILLIFDGDRYQGIATYDSVLEDHGGNGIVRERYVMQTGNDLFGDLRKLFEDKKSSVHIPVFDTDMRLICLAYQYTDPMAGIVERVFELFEQGEHLSIKDLGKQIEKVHICGLNEFAFRMYQILWKRHIPVEIEGKGWADLYPEIYERDKIKDDGIAADRIFDIDAEGKRGGCGWSWRSMYAVAKVRLFCEMERYKSSLLRKGITAYTMIFPDLSELEHHTKDEAYRNRAGIRNEAVALDRTDPHIIQQVEKCWKEGDGDSFDQAMAVGNRRHSGQWIIGAKGTSYKKWGGAGAPAIYLIGPCIVAGFFVDEEDSLGACLYKELKQANIEYAVVCIAAVDDDISTYEKILRSLTLYEDDMVIMIDHHVYFKNEIGKDSKGYTGDIDVKKILEQRKKDWFWDIPVHTNQRGNKEISRILLRDHLENDLQRDMDKKGARKLIQVGESFLDQAMEDQIRQYINGIKEESIDDAEIGAIVMNCNPMTKGHLYLIETALRYVDFLYIFLVEEDRSEIPFEIRYEIVRAVVQRFPNVKVVPSGKFVLSYQTMPIYFEKAVRQEEILDATKDLRIFGSKIAPRLGIRYRFVGEEPHDKITRQYNMAMMKILPAYGIRVIEVQRARYQEQIISASIVRACMKEDNMGLLSRLVPEEALQILKRVQPTKWNEKGRIE